MLSLGLGIWQRGSSAAAFVAPATGLIVCDGNSMTFGVNAPAGEDYPTQLGAIISTGATTWTVQNFGISGQTTPQMTADAVAQVGSLWAGATGAKILLFWEASNDIKVNNVSGATAYANMQAYITAAVNGATGVTVIPMTCPDRSDFTAGNRTAKNDYNTLLLAGYPNTINLATVDPRFDDPNVNDLKDGVHPFSLGYNIICKAIVDKLISLGFIAPAAWNSAAAPTVGTPAGTYATWQTTTLSGGTNLKIYYSLDGSDPILGYASYTRAVPIISTRILRATNYQASKYPKSESFSYTITAAFAPVADRQYNKGGASGSTWTDASGNSRTATLFNAPTINGTGTVSFNGTNQYAKAAARTLAQPFTVVVRLKETSLSSAKYIFDGDTNTNVLAQTWASSGLFNLYAGTAVACQAQSSATAVKTIAAVFNGASSSSQADFGTRVTGNPGAASITGWTMAAHGGGSGAFVPGEYYGAMVIASALTQAEADAHIQWTAENWT